MPRADHLGGQALSLGSEKAADSGVNNAGVECPNLVGDSPLILGNFFAGGIGAWVFFV